MFPVNAGQPKQIVALLNMILTSERDDMHEHINRSIDFPSKKRSIYWALVYRRVALDK
jgi:hypothetical protein